MKVLDKGSVELLAHMGDDLMVVNAARVSFSKWSQFEEKVFDDEDEASAWGEIDEEWLMSDRWMGGYPAKRLSDRDTNLIQYLARHNHWTPFAHPQIQLRVKAPIFVRTQMFKHKVGMVENEVSRRYVDEEPEFYEPTWRSRPDGSVKQGSGGFLSEANQSVNNYRLSHVYRWAKVVYKACLNDGIAPEQARMVLPQSTYTTWIWTGSLAAFARICNQRLDPHAQWETRQYAEAINTLIAPLFPVSWKALVNDHEQNEGTDG